MNTSLGWAKTFSAAALIALTSSAVSAGSFKGANGHVASGSGAVVDGTVELSADFKFDGGPDVYVTLKKGGKLHLLGKLKQNSGAQSYAVPAEAAGASEIFLWCKQYSVNLGVASAD